ncbi:hypothetical protein FB451DRAFT_1451010 [Mycena latifolia]|nr:hypothetical protein FB451DRAFT_1451010 [Mycena latifolia]
MSARSKPVTRRGANAVHRPDSADENPKDKKRQRKGSPSISYANNSYLNPFGAGSTAPLGNSPASNANFISPEPSYRPPVYIQVPLEQYQYGYTPERTVDEEALAQLQQAQFPTTTPSPSSPFLPAHPIAHIPQIDPSLPIDSTLSNSTPIPAQTSTSQRRLKPFGMMPKTTINKDRYSRQTPAPLTPRFRSPAPATPHPQMSALPLHTATSSLESNSTELRSRKHTLEPVTSTSRLPPESLRPPAPSIPKAITDKLFRQEARISALEEKLKEREDKLRAFRKDMEGDMADIDGEQHGILEKVSDLEVILEKQTTTIDRLFALIEGTDIERDFVREDAPPKARDNALNTATRRCLFVAMGIPRTSKLKDAAGIEPRRTGGSYIKDKESNGKLLRPDWSTSFAENSNWHESMVQFVRAKASNLVPALTKQVLDKKTDDDLMDRLEVVFKNIASEYRKTAKNLQNSKLNRPQEEATTDMTPDQERQYNRRRGRKVRKCDERTIAARDIEMDDEWTFFLQPAYQSTDESDDAEVLDPDTDTEKNAEVPASSTRKPWISRPPIYRDEVFADGIEHLDERVMERRCQYEKDNKGKTAAHPRTRGDKKDTPLPFMRQNQAKIKRGAIDPSWLATHKDQDTPSCIDYEYDIDPGQIEAEEDSHSEDNW